MDSSDFWRFDKIDKFVICIIFVFGAFFTFFESFVFAYEPLDVTFDLLGYYRNNLYEVYDSMCVAKAHDELLNPPEGYTTYAYFFTLLRNYTCYVHNDMIYFITDTSSYEYVQDIWYDPSGAPYQLSVRDYSVGSCIVLQYFDNGRIKSLGRNTQRVSVPKCFEGLSIPEWSDFYVNNFGGHSDLDNLNKNINELMLALINSVNNSNFDISNSINSSSSSISNSINSSSSSISNSISDSTDRIENTLTNSSLDDSSMVVDADYSVEGGHQQTIDNFFTNLLENVYNVFVNINVGVETISIPLPKGQSIVLRSDMLSKFVVGTSLEPIIIAFWYFFLGTYIVMFTKRMLDWLSTGKIAEKGVVGFFDFLNSNNEIIKSYMM